MSENIGVATGKIMLKIVIALFKGVWNVLTFGFRAYKGHPASDAPRPTGPSGRRRRNA